MAKNFKKIAAGLLVIAAAILSACQKESNSVGALERVARIPRSGEKIVDRKAEDLKITLNNKETFSFTENLLVRRGELQEWQKGDTFSHSHYFGVAGSSVDTVYTNNTNFNASLISREGSENAWKDGSWAGTQVDSTYSWSISNGEYTFNFKTMASASDAVYSCEDYEVAFPMLDRRISAELSKAEKVTVLNGKTYKETDFVHASEYVFEVPAGFGSDTKTITLVNKLVVLDLQANLTNTIENEDYVLNLMAEGNRAYADVQKNSWDVVVYNYDTEVSRQGNSVDLALSAEASKPASITVKKDDLGKLTLRTLTHGANKVTKTTDGDVEKTSTSLDYVATFNGGNNVTISTIAESAIRGDESLKSAKIQNVRFVGAELASQSDANAVLNLKFGVDFETPNVATKAASSVVTKTISVNQVQVAQDELIRRWGEGEEKVDGSNISVTAKFYEEWTLTGVKLVNTQNGTMKATLKAQEGDDVVSSNINFTTTSNGQAAGTYSSTASNGEKSFNNNYTYTFDESKTFTYEGIEVKFEGKFTVSEVETTIGTIPATKVIDDIAYDAYPYLNKVQGVYTIGAASVTLTAEADRSLLIEREIPKVIPEDWGKIQSMGVAMVPAHQVTGGFADGSSTQYRHKGFCLVCENGAVATVTTMKTIVPAIESIVNGNYVAGDFTGCITAIDTDANGDWNGNGVWYPATVSDSANLIQYFYKGQLHRSLTDKSMSAWGWNEKTSHVGGYEFSVNKKGVLTVRYNGQVVMQIR